MNAQIMQKNVFSKAEIMRFETANPSDRKGFIALQTSTIRRNLLWSLKQNPNKIHENTGTYSSNLTVSLFEAAK
jgi:hypothetical protein